LTGHFSDDFIMVATSKNYPPQMPPFMLIYGLESLPAERLPDEIILSH